MGPVCRKSAIFDMLRYISQTVQDRAAVTIINQQEVTYGLSIGNKINDFE